MPEKRFLFQKTVVVMYDRREKKKKQNEKRDREERKRKEQNGKGTEGSWRLL